jgi:hypothetical protein
VNDPILEHIIQYCGSNVVDDTAARKIWARYEATKWFTLVESGKLSYESLPPDIRRAIQETKHQLDKNAHLFDEFEQKWYAQGRRSTKRHEQDTRRNEILEVTEFGRTNVRYN